MRPAHAVILATVPGRDRLVERALASVAEAISAAACPVLVVIVVDREPAFCDVVRGIAARTVPEARVVWNTRPSGPAGARNMGIGAAFESPDIHAVSFLDDDDWWDPSYLTEVERGIAEADVVVSKVHVHTASRAYDRPAPAAFAPRAFFARNAGVQCSNLSVRRVALEAVGGFDEELPASVDRDLCIRLADRGVRYAALDRALVHIDEAHETLRISARENPARHKGFDLFHARYAHRMTRLERGLSYLRAHLNYGWSPAAATERALLDSMMRVRRCAGDYGVLALTTFADWRMTRELRNAR
jgi:GT2 family glycosyltransferase